MADYKTIHGTTIKNYTTDPDNPIEGQVWYDSTANTLQYQVPNKNTAGTWRTGNDINTTRSYHDGAGTRDASIIFGGSPQAPATPQVANAEVYDGTSWTEVGDLNSARSLLAGCGTSTAALAFGGTIFPSAPNGPAAFAETWNGSSWTEVGDLNEGRNGLGFGGAGTNTAALAFSTESGTVTIELPVIVPVNFITACLATDVDSVASPSVILNAVVPPLVTACST